LDDMQIVWQATVVGELTDVECETFAVSAFTSSGTTKYEGDFHPATGAIASEFQQRLAALETLDVNTVAGSIPGVIYARGDGRAKLALFHPRQDFTPPIDA
jgi:hypothetical protein